jgi:hypothetical protein
MYFMLLLLASVIYWYYLMTNPNYPEYPYSWNPSDGPESEDELGDN